MPVIKANISDKRFRRKWSRPKTSDRSRPFSLRPCSPARRQRQASMRKRRKRGTGCRRPTSCRRRRRICRRQSTRRRRSWRRIERTIRTTTRLRFRTSLRPTTTWTAAAALQRTIITAWTGTVPTLRPWDCICKCIGVIYWYIHRNCTPQPSQRRWTRSPPESPTSRRRSFWSKRTESNRFHRRPQDLEPRFSKNLHPLQDQLRSRAPLLIQSLVQVSPLAGFAINI